MEGEGWKTTLQNDEILMVRLQILIDSEVCINMGRTGKKTIVGYFSA